MAKKQHPHILTLNDWCLQDLKILHQSLGRVSHFCVLGDGHLYFYRVFGDENPTVSQDARIPVYDHTDPRLADGLELFYINPGFLAKSN